MRSTLFVLVGAVALADARLGAQVSPPKPQLPGATSSMPAPIGTQPRIGGRAGRQGAHRQGARRGGMAGALLHGISLTDAQRTQLMNIERRYRDERRTLRGSGTAVGAGAGARDTASHAAARGLRQREFADMRGVLTTAQQTVFDRNVQEWRAGARQRRATRTTGVTSR